MKMKKAIIGKKVGMTQIFDETGKVIPVTVIEAGPCPVVQKKSPDKEGYTAVQLGFEEIEAKKLSKPEKGHLEKSGVALQKHLKEFRLENCDGLDVGDVVKVDPELNLIAVRGAIPGPKGGIVYIKNTVKNITKKPGVQTVSTNPQKKSAKRA